jgi:hypothetical protein
MSKELNSEGDRATNNCNPPESAKSGEKTTDVKEVCGGNEGQRRSNCLLPQR